MSGASALTLDQQIEIEYWNAVERGADRGVALLLWSDWLAGGSTWASAIGSLRRMGCAA